MSAALCATIRSQCCCCHRCHLLSAAVLRCSAAVAAICCGRRMALLPVPVPLICPLPPALHCRRYDGIHGDYSELLSSSIFCLVVPGDGWSARMDDATLHGCIPVIIMVGAAGEAGAVVLCRCQYVRRSQPASGLPQKELQPCSHTAFPHCPAAPLLPALPRSLPLQDNVDVSFDSIIDLSAFSLRIPQADTEKLPEILLAVPEERRQEMRRNMARVWQRCGWAEVRCWVGLLQGWAAANGRGSSAAAWYQLSWLSQDCPPLLLFCAAGSLTAATGRMPSASGRSSRATMRGAAARQQRGCRCWARCQTWIQRQMMHLAQLWPGCTAE